MNVPCRYCKDRSITCHATCKKYAEYAKWREKYRAEVNRINIAENALTNHEINARRKK